MSAPRRALLVIDVQNEYVTGNLPIEYPPLDVSLANIAKAIDAANAAGIPVIAVQHEESESAPLFAKGTHGWQLHKVVTERRYTHLIKKNMASAFAGTDLAQWLAEHEIDTLSIVGYMTHNCDASTAIHARHAGITAEFLHDASGSLPYANGAGAASAEEIHRVFSVVFHSSFAAVASTEQWIAALQSKSAIARDNILQSNRRGRGATP